MKRHASRALSAARRRVGATANPVSPTALGFKTRLPQQHLKHGQCDVYEGDGGAQYLCCKSEVSDRISCGFIWGPTHTGELSPAAPLGVTAATRGPEPSAPQFRFSGGPGQWRGPMNNPALYGVAAPAGTYPPIPAGPPPTSIADWIPAVTFNNPPPGVTTYVYMPGGPVAWLYRAGMSQPTTVKVLHTMAGGPTGLLVHVGSATQVAASLAMPAPPPMLNMVDYGRQWERNPLAIAGQPMGAWPPTPGLMVQRRIGIWLAQNFPDYIRVAQEYPGEHRVLLNFLNGARFVAVTGEFSVGGGCPSGYAELYRIPDAWVLSEPSDTDVIICRPMGLVGNPEIPMEVPRGPAGGSYVAQSPSPTDPTAGCCFVESHGTYIEPATGLSTPTAGWISCPGGEAQWFMHNRPVPESTVAVFTDNAGVRMANIQTGDGQYTLPVCEKSPPAVVDCCVDTKQMVLVCTDPSSRWNGARVTSLHEVHPDGTVTLSFIDPDEGIEKNTRLPLCPEGPPNFRTPPGGRQPPDFRTPPGTPTGNCCYDASTSTLVCDDPNDPRNGLAVTIVNTVVDANGIPHAIVVLPDGSQATVQLCEGPPDHCPRCPPGMWMDPSGNCVQPPQCPKCPPGGDGECPHCPPGYLLDTTTGLCHRCPPSGGCPDGYELVDGVCQPCPPWWEFDGHCCEDCARSGNPAGEGCTSCSRCPGAPAWPPAPVDMYATTNPRRRATKRPISLRPR